jgi:hypothetical protein
MPVRSPHFDAVLAAAMPAGPPPTTSSSKGVAFSKLNSLLSPVNLVS